EAVFGAVDGCAARARRHASLAQHGDGPVLAERRFEASQLAVDAFDRRELGEHEWVVALAEAVEVEDEAAEVAVGQLASLAQEARAAANAPAREEAGGGCRCGFLLARVGAALRLRGRRLVRRRARGGGGVIHCAACYPPWSRAARHAPATRSAIFSAENCSA